MEDFAHLFRNVTGKLPYDFQTRTAGELLAGRNVLLSAPTGAGKTWAAITPFLYARRQKRGLADRLIYALPLRALATSLYEETLRQVGGDGLAVCIQTGEQKGDPLFQGDLTFTTIDQCLSAYLNIPVSLPERLANIGAGALVGSLVVFDEFHLLEPDKAMGTALEMIDRLKGLSRFLIMTATLSRSTRERLAARTGAVQVSLTPEELSKIPSQRDKRRSFRWAGQLTAEAVLTVHRGGRSIVLCNTVRRAQDIYLDLKDKKEPTTKLLLLHSRFFPEDRRQKERHLQAWFGKEATEKDVILVATQVVEAGLDISADNLHTEVCPANSLIQRAGRCARYATPRNVGTVWVYEVESEKPYDGLLRETARKVEGWKSPQLVDAEAEQALLDAIHAESELKALRPFRNPNYRRDKVNEAIDYGDARCIGELIRDAASVGVIITAEPERLSFDGKRWPQMLSVPRTSLYGLGKCFAQKGEGWVAKLPRADDGPEEAGLRFTWDEVTSKEGLELASWLVVVHPRFASYDDDVGLRLGEAGAAPVVEYRDRPPLPRYAYCCETWRAHAQRVVEACQEQAPRYLVAVARLEAALSLPPGTVEAAVELACLLHDAGKLSTGWQGAIRDWQRKVGPDNPVFLSGEPLAHSDYDPEIHWRRQKELRIKRPPHAMEGAFAVAPLVMAWAERQGGADLAEEVGVVVLSAIARHHAPRTKSLNEFRLAAGAGACLGAILGREMGVAHLRDRPRRGEREDFPRELVKAKEDILSLYWLVVRRLRLADWAATEEGSKG